MSQKSGAREPLKDSATKKKDPREELRQRRELIKEKAANERRNMGRKSLPGNIRANIAGKAGTGPQTAGAAPPNDASEPPEPDKTGSDSPGASSDWKSFMLAMEARITANNNERFGKLEKVLDQNEARALENTRAIKDLETKTERVETTLSNKIRACEKLINDKVEEYAAQAEEARAEASAVVVGGALPTGLTDKRIEEYNVCRKSLRVWPVKGPDFKKSLHAFFAAYLKLAPEEIRELGQLSVEKNSQNNSKLEDEVVVVFRNKSVRDSIKSKGTRLAGHSNAGMRIDIPGFLMQKFNLLQSVGYHLKQKDKDTRRSVKFDDPNYSLVLDAKVAGEWRRITPEEAELLVADIPGISSQPRKLQRNELAALLSGGAGSGKSTETSGENEIQID